MVGPPISFYPSSTSNNNNISTTTSSTSKTMPPTRLHYSTSYQSNNNSMDNNNNQNSILTAALMSRQAVHSGATSRKTVNHGSTTSSPSTSKAPSSLNKTPQPNVNSREERRSRRNSLLSINSKSKEDILLHQHTSIHSPTTNSKIDNGLKQNTTASTSSGTYTFNSGNSSTDGKKLGSLKNVFMRPFSSHHHSSNSNQNQVNYSADENHSNAIEPSYSIDMPKSRSVNSTNLPTPITASQTTSINSHSTHTKPSSSSSSVTLTSAISLPSTSSSSSSATTHTSFHQKTTSTSKDKQTQSHHRQQSTSAKAQIMSNGSLLQQNIISPTQVHKQHQNIPPQSKALSPQSSYPPTLSRRNSLKEIQKSTPQLHSLPRLPSPSSVSSSIHPEIQSLLNIHVKKRSDVLKYTLVKTPQSPRGLVGIANLGNTCFMNSILQCIFSTELLLGYILSGDHSKDLNTKSPMKGQLATAFADIVHDVMKCVGNTGKVVKPYVFKKKIEHWAPQFAGYSQQDSQEFLRFMLDGLHEDLNRVHVRPKYTYKDEDVEKLSDSDKARLSWNRYNAYSSSFIFDLFGGQLQSTVTCLKCGHPSVTFDAFWDLSLQIPKKYRDKSFSQKQCSISDCLQEFAAEEILEELYKCDHCKSKQKASKCLKIYKCPEVLVLHLKRFSFTTYSRDKIETSVTFSKDQLSLESIMSNTQGCDQLQYYELFGMSNHMGGLGGGHYIAHCKNPDDGLWYERNDGVVSRVSESDVMRMGSSAYVLFFIKSRSGIAS